MQAITLAAMVETAVDAAQQVIQRATDVTKCLTSNSQILLCRSDERNS